MLAKSFRLSIVGVAMNNTIKFQVGQSYFCRSVCDYECVWTFTVTSRTEKQITFVGDSTQGKQVTKGVKLWNNVEQIFPLGKYSMAPLLTAEKLVTDPR